MREGNRDDTPVDQLHSRKVIAWCSMARQSVTGPYYFDDLTVSGSIFAFNSQLILTNDYKLTQQRFFQSIQSSSTFLSDIQAITECMGWKTRSFQLASKISGSHSTLIILSRSIRREKIILLRTILHAKIRINSCLPSYMRLCGLNCLNINKFEYVSCALDIRSLQLIFVCMFKVSAQQK